MSNKDNLSLIKKIAKYEIWWLFLYLAFSLSIVIVLIASVIENNHTIKIINDAFIILDILVIIFIILYLISLVYIENKNVVSRWTFYISIIMLTINLIALPILVHYLKLEYPKYQTKNILNSNAQLSAILWLTFIFTMFNFVFSIAITGFTYKEAFPINSMIIENNKESDNEI